MENNESKEIGCAFAFSLSPDDNIYLGATFLSEHPFRLTTGEKPLLGFSVLPIKNKDLSTTMIVVIVFVVLAVVGAIVGVAIWQKKKKSDSNKRKVEER